jgi:cell division protein FtsL
LVRTRPAGRSIRFPVALVVAGVVLVFGIVTVQAVSSQSAFRLDRLSQKTAVLQEEHGRLKLQVARLSAPGRILQAARVLGLELPEEVHTVRVPGPSPRSDLTPEGTERFSLKRDLGSEP